jgi:hypothetical protein
MELLILASARKHGIADEDMLHAYDTFVRAEYLGEGFTMLTGYARDDALLEIGIVDGPAIAHAMPCRRRYLP